MSVLVNKKQKSKELLESYKKSKNISLIKEAILLDDTNPEIIFPYLSNLEKEKNRYAFSREFSKYKLALPKKLLLELTPNVKILSQKALFFSMIITMINEKYSVKEIINLLKKNFGDDRYLSHKFNQPITVENLNLFYYNIITTIMTKVLDKNSDKAHNFVISLIEKINYSLDYFEEIKNMEIITKQNSLNFHLFFFNFIFTENFKLFKDFYDSIIIKKITDFNYFSSHLECIKEFLKEIGNSEAIKSLLCFLDENYINYIEDIPKMIDYIFDGKLYFNSVEIKKFTGLTWNDTLDVYASGKPILPDKFNEQNLTISEILIINLGRIIVTLIHEIYGHFMKIYLNKTYKYGKENSPKNLDLIYKLDQSDKEYNEEEKNVIFDFKNLYVSNEEFQKESEGGDQLEIFLFGNKVNYISIAQCFYLLNLKNYEKSFYTFRKEFNEITNYIDEHYSSFLKSKEVDEGKKENIEGAVKYNKSIKEKKKSFLNKVKKEGLCELGNIEKNEFDILIIPNKDDFKYESDKKDKEDELDEKKKLKTDKDLEEMDKNVLNRKLKIHHLIYDDIKFNSLLTKDIFENFRSREKKNESFISLYDKYILINSNYLFEPRIQFGRCGTYLTKKMIRKEN